MPMPCSPEITRQAARQHHDARHGLVRGLQHLVVVAVDRDVGVHVAVAGVHVQRHPDAAPSTGGGCAGTRGMGLERRAGEDAPQRRADLRLPRGAQRGPAARSERQLGPVSVAPRQLRHPANCHRPRTSASSASACCTRSSSSSAEGISPASSVLPSGRCPGEEGLRSASTSSASLLRRLSSMLMRSMPSVYSPCAAGDHHVLVDLEGVGVAADRGGALAVEPELLARLALTATKPSPARLLAMRTTSLVARATASASSPAMSPTSTIFGRPPRLLLVA